MDTPKTQLLNSPDTYGTFPDNTDSSNIQTEQEVVDPYAIPACTPETQDVQVAVVQDHSTNTSIPPTQTHVYKRRWYVLLVFSILAGCQGCAWNTWGPIAASSEEAFGWDDADIALLSNWGPISYLLSAVIFAWIIDVKGLRMAMVITGFFITAGTGIRCITSEPPYVKWTVNIAQFLNGIGGPVAMGLPPVLSSTWFPPHERTTATAVTLIFNYGFLAGSFVIGPYFVSDKPPSNSTENSAGFSDMLASNHSDVMERIHRERKEIMFLLYVEFGFVAFIYLLVLVYFPAKPKIPPSTTASIARMKFRTGFIKLFKNSQFWVICLTYGLSLGIFNAWQSVLDVNLKPHGISENEAGWIGFYSTVSAAVSCVIVGRFADIYSKHMRLFLLVLYTGSTLAMAWFILLINGYIPESKVSLYVSVIVSTILITSTPALYYEMVCEITFPVAEGITNLWLTTMNNLGGLLFLFVQMIPNIGTVWENWCVIGAMVACIPVLCTFKEHYYRLEVDERSENQT
ncbi:solute carrier family 49 member 4 homolog [Pecten maximus]|uniref:solute carrier family 49 member 4 homolog n=1 Tax=Pecten maximus TaxID=6579 RepID=UPI00145804CC|nr:solute carrier family 49 member 4 homolog [Pecten maximus]XP_033742488.1 solute carrier family 49 member 4 homolog [Pecten maximus]